MTAISKACLADTNVLLRLVRPFDPEHATIRRYFATAIARDWPVFHCSQNVVEFWNVLTRPVSRNGMGQTTEDALTLLENANGFSRLLVDHAEVQGEWQRLVIQKRVTGPAVFDARLVATMNVYGITRIITRNAADFKRYEHIQIIDPGADEA